MALHRLRRKVETLPPCMKELMIRVQTNAPPQARGYRLFWLNRDGSEVGYPNTERRPWLASSGRSSWARSFRLWPFEIPSVPHSGTYGVGYIATGQIELRTPDELLDGVEVEALYPTGTR